MATKPRLLRSWKVSMDGHVLFRVNVLDTFDLAATLHRKIGLSGNHQVRLAVNQETLEPSGNGWVCRPDGTVVKPFRVVPAAHVRDCQPRAAA